MILCTQGHIMSRLSKDQDTIDTELSMIAVQLLTNRSTVIGTAGLVFYIFSYLSILFVPMIVFYYIAAVYYRRSSVEMKRLDSLLRSILYASYSGMYGRWPRFCTVIRSLMPDVTQRL